MGIITSKTINVLNNKELKATIEYYSSAMEVVEDCEERRITDSDFHDMKHYDIERGWHGVESYEEALDYLKNGYQPTVDKLKNSMKASVLGDGKRISFENDIVGAVPVVPLAMMGMPKNMVNMRMKPIKCKVVDIYYDTVCSGGTSPEKIIENGQKLLEAILSLESQGYRFNLYAMQTYSDGYENECNADILCVKIKSSNQPIDLKRISFPLTHTAFFRVIGFDWYSKCPKAIYRDCYGYGLSYKLCIDELRDATKKLFGNNAIYISGKEIMKNGYDYIEGVLKNA